MGRMTAPTPRYDGPLRVLVVDADDRVRESLTGLLTIGGRVTVIGSASHPTTALELAMERTPDVVVVDPRLPEADGGMAFIARLRAHLPSVRILAMCWSDTFEAPSIQSGADGFVRKTFRPNDLVAAVLATTRSDDAA